MAQDYDAIIIGGGHNGLTCGAYLAKAGLSTLVLERRPMVGGAAVSEEVFKGFTFSVFSYVMSLLHPKVIEELELARYGLKVLPATDLYCPLRDDDYILYSDDVARTQAQFARFSRQDAEAYPAFLAYLQESAAILRKLQLETPPDPSRRDWKSFKDLALLLWRYREHAGELYRVIDLFTQSADVFLSRWFRNDTIKAVLAYYASIGSFTGPKSPGSAYVILHHLIGEHEGAGGWGFVRGGMGAISDALATSGQSHGLKIKTNAEIDKVLVDDDRVLGVVTKSGDEYRAKVVASNASAKVLFLDLIDPSDLPAVFLDEIKQFRTYSTAFKINVAAKRPPQYKGFDAEKCGFEVPSYVHMAPDIDYLERAYDDAKHGWYSYRPFITAVVPTTVDNSIAPEGKHVVNLFGGHAPYNLRNGSWQQQRGDFVRNVMNTIHEFAPGFADDVIDMQVLLPPDIEEILNIPHGHIFHGELSPDQLFFMRPVPRFADYRTPIKGLYQCGASCHPGGGVSGLPGHNAAREILKDVGTKKKRGA